MNPHWHRSRHAYPLAALPAEADLVVIGGGIVGCSLALGLAEAGLRPLLLERRWIADGASGRNGGLLLPGTSEPFGDLARRWGEAAAAELWRASEDGARRLVARIESLEAAGLDCGWRAEGGLHAALSPEEAADLRADAAGLSALGLSARWLDRTELAGWSDLRLPPDIEGALLLPGGGCLHSGRLVTALAAAAVRAGAQIVEGANVERIDDGATLHLQTSAGSLSAGAVLVAGNAWTPQLLPELAPALKPIRGQMLATTPRAPRRIRGGWSLNRGYEYLQQRPDGRVLVGGMRWTAPDREEGLTDALPEPGIQGRLEAWLAASWPDLAARAEPAMPTIEARWAGIMAWTPDRLPLIGAVPGRPGIWLACGFSGHGLPFAPLAAEILLAGLQGRAPAPSSHAFDPGRFVGGRS
ncbi:MAG: FAD-binding oxidoreductase [Chloroflexi bacterium]|nr:FAD-binding oxidoreductase [Chloroflexota bacterium]